MKRSGLLWFSLWILPVSGVMADGLSIGKIYDPYVQPLEKEIEFQSQYLVDNNDHLDGSYLYKLGYGQALNDRWFAELYLIAEGESGNGSKLEGYEAELKYQITEQGEYAADWGMLFELEREQEDDVWESSLTLIGQKDLARFSLVGNLSLVNESGDEIDNEWETGFAGQARYRYRPYLEPGLELFSSQDTKALGPSFNGVARLSGARKLLWQAAFLAGLNSDTPDLDVKLNLEYEF